MSRIGGHFIVSRAWFLMTKISIFKFTQKAYNIDMERKSYTYNFLSFSNGSKMVSAIIFKTLLFRSNVVKFESPVKTPASKICRLFENRNSFSITPLLRNIPSGICSIQFCPKCSSFMEISFWNSCPLSYKSVKKTNLVFTYSLKNVIFLKYYASIKYVLHNKFRKSLRTNVKSLFVGEFARKHTTLLIISSLLHIYNLVQSVYCFVMKF